MKNKFWLSTSLVLLLAFMLSGCAPTVVEVQHPPLRVEWTIYEADYTMVIAQEKGFFDKHGVQVEPVYYENYSQLLPDIAEKKLDGALFTMADMLRTSKLVPLKGVIAYDSGGSAFIMSTTEIGSVTDLRGKNIGIPLGGNEEIYVREMLATAGMTIKDVQLVDIPVEEVPTRLGVDIDAGYVYAPFNQLAIDAGHKALFSLKDTFFPDMIAFRSDVVQERPEDIRAFVNAWFDALQYRVDHADECNQIIAEKTGYSLEEVSIVTAVHFNRQDNLQLFNSDGTTQSIYEITQNVVDFYNSKGQLTYPINVEEVYDPSFLGQ